MNKNQVAKKFSRVLINMFDIPDIHRVLDGLQIFSKLIDANMELKLLFTSRIFTEDEKNMALKILLSRLKVSQQTEKFLKLIIIQGYLPAIKEIIKASAEAYSKRLKKITAFVISPVNLEKKYINRLKDTLKKLTHSDIDIESEIDPSLLAGFIVKVGSTVYDSSLKGQFRLLKAELTK